MEFAMKIRHFVLVLMLTTLAACKEESSDTVAAPIEPASAPVAAPVATPAPAPVAAPAPKPVVRHEPRRETRPVVVKAPEPKVICDDCGVVTSMTAITQEGEASGAGAVLGAIAGGFAGNQFGGGHGKEAATAAGAIAGGIGGHMAEKKIRENTAYKVAVKMDSGYTRTVTVPAESASSYSVGSKVRVSGENNISLR
jgi:outer membrane lipoprotein SlyB